MAVIFDTILQGYTSARKQTQRNLSLGLVFTLVCFFYVVEPFFLYTSHQRAAVQRSDQIHDEVQQLNMHLRQTQAVNRQTQQALEMIHERIRAYPDHLNQDVLPQIRDHFYAADRDEPEYRDDPEYQFDPDYRYDTAAGPGAGPGERSGEPGERKGDSGMWDGDPGMLDADQSVRFGDPEVRVAVPDHITEFADAVNWYVRNWFRQIIDDLYSDIVEPIQQNELLAERDLFESGEEPARLETLTQQAVEAVSGHLETVDPDFWHSYEDGKVATVGELQNVIDRSFEPVTVRLDDIHLMISASIDDMQFALEELAVESSEISASLDHLNERIDAMSSPFGAIPLRATELIVLFPLLVVLIVLFSVLSLVKSARLYGELWRLYQSDDKEVTSGSKKRVASGDAGQVRDFKLLTDCWYLPPWNSPVQPALLILYALAMSGIFIYSCFLIWADPGVFRFPGMGEETFRRSLFLAAYVAGFFVMAGTFWIGYKKLTGVPVPNA